MRAGPRVRHEFIPYAIAFREPVATGAGEWVERRGAWLRLEADDGRVGLGEAAPRTLAEAFAIQRAAQPPDPDGAMRFQVRAALAGRPFDAVAIDLGLRDPFGWQPELLPGTGLLSFVGIAPIVVPVLPLEQQVAEKLHAYTRRYGGEGAPSSRVKDLIDLVLIRTHATMLAGHLQRALDDTFQGRGTHALPAYLPAPPAEWAIGYRRLAQEVGIDPALTTGYGLAALLLDPILARTIAAQARWRPGEGRWRIT